MPLPVISCIGLSIAEVLYLPPVSAFSYTERKSVDGKDVSSVPTLCLIFFLVYQANRQR